MSNCINCNEYRSCAEHRSFGGDFTYSGGGVECSMGCCVSEGRRRRRAPQGVRLTESVGRGVMGASFAIYNGEEYVAKPVPAYKQRREIYAAEMAARFGVECPELIEFDGWVLSKRVAQVSHEVEDRFCDEGFIDWLAKVAAFDACIGNYDRHVYNILMAPSGFYVIDHERIRPHTAVERCKQVFEGLASTAIDWNSAAVAKQVRERAEAVLRGWVQDGTVAAALGAATAEALA